jgi:hypothetical protein
MPLLAKAMTDKGYQVLTQALRPSFYGVLMSPLKRLREKLRSTATLVCVSMAKAAKPAQARVPVLLKAASN